VKTGTVSASPAAAKARVFLREEKGELGNDSLSSHSLSDNSETVVFTINIFRRKEQAQAQNFGLKLL